MKTTVGIIVAVLVIAGVVFVVNNQNKQQEPEEKQAMMEEKEDEAMVKDEKMMTDDKDAMMQKAGNYKDYSAATVEAEQQASNKVVLFFHASWCPFCKAADSAFKSRASEIPAGVTVLKTDYDSSTELKQKYGVTYQHTFVQIDESENQVSKWNGGDIDNLKKYLK